MWRTIWRVHSKLFVTRPCSTWVNNKNLLVRHVCHTSETNFPDQAVLSLLNKKASGSEGVGLGEGPLRAINQLRGGSRGSPVTQPGQAQGSYEGLQSLQTGKSTPRNRTIGRTSPAPSARAAPNPILYLSVLTVHQGPSQSGWSCGCPPFSSHHRHVGEPKHIGNRIWAGDRCLLVRTLGHWLVHLLLAIASHKMWCVNFLKRVTYTIKIHTVCYVLLNHSHIVVYN